MSRKLVAGIGMLAVLALAAVVLIKAVTGEDYRFAGGEITIAQAAAPLDLIDQDGQPFSLDQLKGNVILLYFGYTTCPDLCPTTLSDFMAVKDGLGDRADKVKFLMVTVDPARDSTARLKEYLGFFDPGFIGLRGDDAQTELVKQEYGVVATRVDYPDSAVGYLVDHTSLIYVIDDDGRFRLTYSYGTDPALIVPDIEHLLN